MKKKRNQLSKEYLQPGTMVGEVRYRIDGMSEDNGITVTYCGYDTFRKREVVVRELFPREIMNRDYDHDDDIVCKKLSDESVFEGMKEHLIARAKKLIKLYPFEGIVNVLTYFEEHNTVYVIEEATSGQSLKDFFQKRHSAKFTVEDIMKQMEPVMDTLSRLHEKGIVHGCICPENIILTTDRKVVLKQVMNPVEDLAWECLGSPTVRRDGYAPVELYLPEADRGPFTDVYGVAALFYRYVTGDDVPAYYLRINGDEEALRPADTMTRIMTFQSDALMKALSIYGFDRYQTMEELQKALQPEDLDTKSLYSQQETVKYQKRKPFWYALAEKQRRQYYIAFTAIVAVGLIIMVPRLFHVGQDERINRFYKQFVKASTYEQCDMLASLSRHEREIFTNDYYDMDASLSDEQRSEAFVAKYYDFQLKKYVTHEKINQNRPYYEYLKIDYRDKRAYVTYLSNEQSWQEEIYLEKQSDGSYTVDRSESKKDGKVTSEKLSVRP